MIPRRSAAPGGPACTPAGRRAPSAASVPSRAGGIEPGAPGDAPPGAGPPKLTGEALRTLDREFYRRPVLEIARDLLGRLLVHDAPDGRVAARIVETEAYGGEGLDPASHAYHGATRRNAVMFGPPGHLYVYFTYGMHHCANVVCGPAGVGQAVLLRAGEPVAGVEGMADRFPARLPRDLTRGPARLASALGIGPWANGADLVRGPLRLAAGWPVGEALVAWTPRVGISRAIERPWRAVVVDSRYVSSGPRRFRPG